MKHLITIFLIVSCSVCYGQPTGKVIAGHNGHEIYLDTSPDKGMSVYYGDATLTHPVRLTILPPKRQYDTVRVIMLVSDTSKSFDHSVRWLFGYQVKELHKSIYASACGNCNDFWKHIEYLDINKKPLKNIVVIAIQKVDLKDKF